MGTVKNQKFDFFDILTGSVGQIIADTFSIDECVIACSKKPKSNEKALYLQGRLKWGQQGYRNQLSTSALFTQKQIIFTVALNKAPGKMLDDFLARDAPAKDSRPSLPSITVL